jgi:hypothetical protein
MHFCDPYRTVCAKLYVRTFGLHRVRVQLTPSIIHNPGSGTPLCTMRTKVISMIMVFISQLPR